MRVSAVAVALLLGAAMAAAGVRASNGLFTVRQNPQGDAQIVVINPVDGTFSAKSALSFNFVFPYVETTVDPVNGVAYLVWIDSVHSSTYLYAINGRNTYLPVVGKWNMTGHFFFDLQYNSAQQTLYGIDVVSTYGRTLSNFTFGGDDAVAINHLVQMPMDWYVNASSFDPATGRYFALLNNFPGLPNATVAQKFVVADFAQPVTPPNPAPDQVFDLQPHDGTFVYHFIGWNAVEGTAYGLATGPSQVQPGAESTWLATIDPGSGATELVTPVETLETGPTWPGPLMIDPNSGNVYAYVKARNSGIWSLVGLSGGVQIIANYDAEWSFSAATFAAW